MPGAYTHLTMANELTERRTLERMPGMPPEIIAFSGPLRHYCELGVVSPDYPYLQIGFKNANGWADLMHYNRTDAVVREAIPILRTYSGERREKGLMWLLGYFTHVIMDVTVHPVINLKVGNYAENKTEHRRCEMHQDVHIFKQRMNLSVTLSEFLNSGVLRCGPTRGELDQDIEQLWKTILARVHADQFAAHEPSPATWHRWFGTIVDKVAEEGNWLVSLSRHMLGADPAFTYDREANPQYIKDLPTPRGTPIHFDALFTKAKDHACELWPYIVRAVLNGDDGYQNQIAHWDMDSGLDEAGRLVFWS